MLTLANGFELHLAEYVVTAPQIQRPKYRYHLQQPDGTQVVRWTTRRITAKYQPILIIATPLTTLQKSLRK